MHANTPNKSYSLKFFLSLFLFIIITVSCGAPPDQNQPGDPPPRPGEETEADTDAPVDNNSDGDTTNISAGDCDDIADAFAATSDLVTVTCDDDYIYVTTETGLPAHDEDDDHTKIMVGITAWILRVPLPYQYDWKIPLNPEFVSTFEEVSAKGPVAFAVDGVPIFHLERRPDVSTLPSNYDPGSDTVLQGELDQCGGHAGQGDDYHYHYVPICLLENFDLSHPIAFGLDGIPIYFGTGGTDFYGNGGYNDLDNLPNQELDECNGHEQDDGTYVYYTTNDAPYMIGCHKAHFDSSLQIEPRPLNGRAQGTANSYGGSYGEPTHTLMTDYYTDNEGWTHLEHNSFSGSGTSAVVFRPSDQGNDCWDFQFRKDANIESDIETFCR